jgi:hypothetical protein
VAAGKNCQELLTDHIFALVTVIMPANKSIIFRILGAVSVLLGIGCFSVAFRNMDVAASGGRELSVLFCWAAAFLIVGISSLMCRSWADYLLVFVGAICGIVMIVGSLFNIPFPWVLLNMGFGAVLLAPAIALIKGRPRSTTQ